MISNYLKNAIFGGTSAADAYAVPKTLNVTAAYGWERGGAYAHTEVSYGRDGWSSNFGPPKVRMRVCV